MMHGSRDFMLTKSVTRTICVIALLAGSFKTVAGTVFVRGVWVSALSQADCSTDRMYNESQWTEYINASDEDIVRSARTTQSGFDFFSDQGKAQRCNEKWRKGGKNNTMCAYRDSQNATDVGLTAEMKRQIVNLHNKYRRLERASNMVEMYWDGNLAMLAQKMAQTCLDQHDENHQRQIPGYDIHIGQNRCDGLRTWEICITAWYLEKKDHVFGGNNSLDLVGHYTQGVNARANLIGCGYAKCGERPHMFCNYAYGQTYKEFSQPYTRGRTCASCPGFCNNGLCDCGNKLCSNKGTLDVATCTCKCRIPYTGDSCMAVVCPEKDPPCCDSGSYGRSNCDQYSHFSSMCPYLCGVC